MSDHDTQDVSGCCDCPMLHKQAYSYGDFCGAVMLPSGSYRSMDDVMDETVAPDWCPLRTRPVLVRLVAKESR